MLVEDVSVSARTRECELAIGGSGLISARGRTASSEGSKVTASLQNACALCTQAALLSQRDPGSAARMHDWLATHARATYTGTYTRTHTHARVVILRERRARGRVDGGERAAVGAGVVMCKR